MARYIDADALNPDYIVGSTSTNTECYRYVSLEQIMNAPTANAVEVVRCKDCKYHDGLDGQCPVQSTGDPFYDYKPDDNWYCGDGERRA